MRFQVERYKKYFIVVDEIGNRCSHKHILESAAIRCARLQTNRKIPVKRRNWAREKVHLIITCKEAHPRDKFKCLLNHTWCGYRSPPRNPNILLTDDYYKATCLHCLNTYMWYLEPKDFGYKEIKDKW